jgi:hypothetical protein
MRQDNNNSSSPPSMMAAASLLPPREGDKTFSLTSMVPDIEAITIDEEDINEETEEMINHCITTCPKIGPEALNSDFKSTTRREAEPEAKRSNDLTNSAKHCPSGHRAVHTLKSSLKSSSDSTASTTLMDESSTSIMMDDSQRSMRRRSVCFSSLEIRSYDVTLGNTPTFYGPPVTLDWNYDDAETQVYDVDFYEHHRHPRRTKCELVIPPSHREYSLMIEGFSRSQIKIATEEAKRAAKQREKTIKTLNRTSRLSLDEMWDKAKNISTLGIRRRASDQW